MKGQENLIPSSERTPEERREIAVKAGIASGVARREKRDAKQAIRILLDLAAQGKLDDNLAKLQVPENERTNMMAVSARMFAKAMEGDVAAYRSLMEYGGFSIDQDLKTEERIARIEAIREGGRAGAISSCGDEDDSGDVIIYLPELDDNVEKIKNENGSSDANEKDTDAEVGTDAEK